MSVFYIYKERGFKREMIKVCFSNPYTNNQSFGSKVKIGYDLDIIRIKVRNGWLDKNDVVEAIIEELDNPKTDDCRRSALESFTKNILKVDLKNFKK